MSSTPKIWAIKACGVGLFVTLSMTSYADWNTPAQFDVTAVSVNDSPGAWTATMSDGPVNSWVDQASFEPMVMRRKWHATGSSSNELIIGESNIHYYNSYRDGLYDGAAVRIYRIANGAFVKIREDTIAHHYSSDWIECVGDGETELIDPAVTTATVNFENWYKNDEYHFTVVAVDAQGNRSSKATPVTVFWEEWTDYEGDESNTLIDFAAVDASNNSNLEADMDAPATPANLAAEYDPATGLITLTWDAVEDDALAGYAVFYCDRDPENLNGYHLFLTDSPTDPDLYVQTGDMIFMEKEMTSWDKRIYLSHRVYDTGAFGGTVGVIPYHVDDANTWELVAHPTDNGSLPEELELQGGQTCLQMDVNTNKTFYMAQYNYASTGQTWYEVLETNKTYVAEVWLRQANMDDPTVSFGLTAHYSSTISTTDFEVTDEWQKFTTTFTPETVYTNSGGSVGQMRLSFNGPGTLWVDNFRVYDQEAEYMDFLPKDYEALEQSGLQYLRTHSTIKSGWGYTMDMLTNPRGVMGKRGWNGSNSDHTLDSLLTLMETANIKPWLQMEMYMSEDEWLGWVEYMAATYDPDVDSPEDKPWAYKRYLQGHEAPWTDSFDDLLFEISNETWNGLFSPWTFMGYSMTDRETGSAYSSGELYGLWQEYVIGILRSSAYWTDAVDDQFEFVLGGWAAQRTSSGYGQTAATMSSNSLHMTVAGYNGGWDEGESPAEANDETRFKTLAFAVQAAEPRAAMLATTLAEMQESGDADYMLGTYEAGPGYNLNGLNGVSMDADQVEAESQVMKSLIGGTATLDSFLMRAAYGYDLQNFFTFSRNRNYWVSHARWYNGGQAYPCWSALSLYNRYAVGDHLLVNCESTPTYDLEETDSRDALDHAAMTAVYATQQDDRFGIFCISRKMDEYPYAGDDGFTPMSVRLPFTLTTDSTITLHKLTGDTRSHNLDSNSVHLVTESLSTNLFSQSFVLNEETGADDRGLPPASTFLYVFDHVQVERVGSYSTASVRLSDGADTTTLQLPVTFKVTFDQSIDPDSFTTSDISFKGTAEISDVSVEAVDFTANSVFLITVSGADTLGTVIPYIEAGSVDTTAGGVNGDSEYTGDVMTLAVPDEGGSYSFTATDDTELCNYTEGPHGDDTYLTTLGAYVHGWGNRIFLKFPTIPDLDNRQPSSAKVRLYYVSSGTGLTTTTNEDYHVLLPFHDDWNEDTYNDSLEEAYAEHGNNVVSDTVSVQTKLMWYEFDCTDYVLSELAGDRTVSVAFDFSTEGEQSSFKRWYTKEYSSGNYAPELVLCFDSTNYIGWSSLYNLKGSSSGDDDDDGWNNFYEYALGGNPTNSADQGLLSCVISGTDVQVVYARRSDGSVSYTLATTTNLVSGSWITNDTVEVEAIGPIDADYESVTNRLDPEPQQFIRISVE
jgi:hypothetical protein